MAKRKLAPAVAPQPEWNPSKIELDDLANANTDLWNLNQLCVWCPPGDDSKGDAFANAVSAMAIRVGMHLDKALESAGAESHGWADEI